MELLRIENCKKSFGNLKVLNDISLKVNKGEVVSILGPSGSGKSTLLRCATMLDFFDDGNLIYENNYACKSVNGKAVYSSKNSLKNIQRYYSLVFQNFNLFPHMSVFQNITDAPIRILKRDKDEVYENAKKLIKKMGLVEKEDCYPSSLSGGQMQRVAIARALNMKPDILFFDEPTSALDPELTQEVLRIIKELANEKITMAIVTHEISFAKLVSDSIIFMDGGYIVEEGPPSKVIDNPQMDRTKKFLKKITSL